MKSVRSFTSNQDNLNLDYQKYRSMALNPLVPTKGHISDQLLETKAKQIFQWARRKGALYYTFFAYPSTEGVLEKQETFLDLDYFFKQNLASSGKSAFSFQQLRKGQGDGSSFPSGGLRVTHKARAYTVWDTKSEVFLRKNNVLYIPSLLVTHHGEALDDKTLFRKAERILQVNAMDLLSKLGIRASAVVLALGLQQQFFVLKKQAVDQRLDIKSTGRTLVGIMPSKHQQFSDHYYGKLPEKIERILNEAEQQLLSIGVPCKTRHKEVAPNQFQFCPLFEEAGKAIDHNMIMMEILKQKFAKEGLVAVFHEKPFLHLNGSGKHCNFSINYVDAQGSLYNLFGIPKDKGNQTLFKLFILIQLKALMKNSKLYLSSVACTGNELRLGGHEAPPRIISAFLGDTVSSIIDETSVRAKGNLKNELPNLPFDLLQEDTDRNRTSPFAYTGNKFEFRAVGSSQNVCFPMAVVAATIAESIKDVCEKLDRGISVESIISQLREETKPIRFNGNGYSHEWVEQAKQRGLYVNEKFFENIDNVKESGKIFVDLEICKQKELEAKYQNMKNNYLNTVETQKDCLLHMLSSQIVPRSYEYLRLVQPQTGSSIINKRSNLFISEFEKMVEKEEELKEWSGERTIENGCALRHLIGESCDQINKVLQLLPRSKEFPQFQDFMHQY